MYIIDKIRKNKFIIIILILAFIIGYIIGTVLCYIAWRENVDTTIVHLEKLQILGKGKYDIQAVKNQIEKIKQVHNEHKYKDTVKELQELEKIYPNLLLDSEFQRLLKKIE